MIVKTFEKFMPKICDLMKTGKLVVVLGVVNSSHVKDQLLDVSTLRRDNISSKDTDLGIRTPQL